MREGAPMGTTPMDTIAVVMEAPEHLVLSRLDLPAPKADELVVEIEWSGISTGTERLLWSGRMPHFPGMGYPLVPGYEAVGRVVATGSAATVAVGTRVFVPGAKCYGAVRGLFGAASARLVVAEARVVPLEDDLGEAGVLMALAATAHHAVAGGELPDLIVGHGVLGRLLARLTLLAGGDPVVWECHAQRRRDGTGYRIVDPAQDSRRDYRSIYDVSGDPTVLDNLIAHAGHGAEIVLAGFYAEPLRFAFPPAFLREVRLRVAAEWREPDLSAVKRLLASGDLSLAGLVTHREPARRADAAYRTAFADPACLKMVLDWRASA